VQGVPSLGTTAGHPGVVGALEHCHVNGGTQAPPPHPQTQIESAYVQTSPEVVHTVCAEGSVLGQSVGVTHVPPTVSQPPSVQVHAVRQSGLTESPYVH
jgi:hypothetical protein